MTIGMLVESLTSKTGALSGQFPNASPFQKCDNADFESPLERYGTQLEAAGFAKHGGELHSCSCTHLEAAAFAAHGLEHCGLSHGAAAVLQPPAGGSHLWQMTSVCLKPTRPLY